MMVCQITVCSQPQSDPQLVRYRSELRRSIRGVKVAQLGSVLCFSHGHPTVVCFMESNSARSLGSARAFRKLATTMEQDSDNMIRGQKSTWCHHTPVVVADR